MHKKILRIFSLALAIMLLFSMLPMSVSAADSSEVERINAQIKTLYKQTLRGSGKYSLHGYCGTMVNWHLYLLGITTNVVGNDGNTQYDYYAPQEYTSGGYRVQAFSAADYNLEEALNAISYNGTRDVYNLVICFQRTNTSAGRRYGHALVVHAILDGTVYYSESYSTTLDGKFYPEGSPIACSISDFARYYNSWTVFEGVLHFGLKTYAESCTYFPSYLHVSMTEDTTMYTAPCQPHVDDRAKELRVMKAGERITVTGLYRNTEGEYWYQVEDSQLGYIPADQTRVLTMCYDDITLNGVGAPTVLRTGRTFDVKGKVKSRFNEITSVRAQVFTYAKSSKAHVMSSSESVEGNSFSLSGTQLSNQLSFRLLEEGSYRYELAVVVGNNYYADGCLQTEWKTLKLWASDFQVTQSTSGNCKVTFDANGGSTSLNAVDMAVGDPLAELPQATRDGYVFDGWFTADGQQVTSGYEVDGNMTLYARWTNATDIDGWYVKDGNWYYYVDGQIQTGFVEIDGVVYHLNAEGYLDTGLMRVEGKVYYFHANGAMHYGWLDLDGDRYYMLSDGSAAVGWLEIDSVYYYFSKLGILQEDMTNNKMPSQNEATAFLRPGKSSQFSRFLFPIPLLAVQNQRL